MKKKFLMLSSALVIGCLLLGLLQALLVPKYMDKSKEGNLIGEYYANAGGNDVIFIGDCEVYENFSPITMWEKYGITSYIRGSAQQLIRMTLDGMRWSSSKWNSIFASMTQEEKEKEAVFSYLVPLLRDHDRWSQLTMDDFTYWFSRPQVSDNGYLMQTGVKPLGDPHVEKPLADYSFGENSWYYLDKMVQLCNSKGVQLVLIKAPALSPVWWPQWDEQIEAYAKEKDLLYINMLDHQEEMGIDWSTDTYDTGLHLNVYGAEKAAAWFGKVLQEQCQIPDRRSDAEISALWAEKTEVYHARKTAMETQD